MARRRLATQLKRLFAAGWEATRNHANGYPVAEPFLIPLNTPSPPGWRYVDVELPAPTVELKVESRPGSTFPYLDSSAPVEGFQGKVPFLQRDDGRAYVFPCFAEAISAGPERRENAIWYTYIDEHIFFEFRSLPMSGLELGSGRDYGFRVPPGRELWPVDPLGNPVSPEIHRRSDDPLSRYSHLSYRQWLNARVGVTDAWPMWRTPPRKMGITPGSYRPLPDNHCTTVSVGAYGPQIQYGYCAGMVDSSYKLSFPEAPARSSQRSDRVA